MKNNKLLGLALTVIASFSAYAEPTPAEGDSSPSSIEASDLSGAITNSSPSTVIPVSEASKRALVHSDVKGEVEILKLKLTRDTLLEQLKVLEERSKSSVYARELKKMEKYYEDEKAKLEESHQKELQDLRNYMSKDNKRQGEALVSGYKKEISELNDKLLNSMSLEVKLRSEISQLKNKKLSDFSENAIRPTSNVNIADLSGIYLTRVDDIFGKKKAQIYYKNNSKWVSKGDVIVDGLVVSKIKGDSIVVKHEFSGSVRSIPMVTIEFAESKSGIADLITQPSEVVEKSSPKPRKRIKQRLSSSESTSDPMGLQSDSLAPPKF